MIHPAAEDLIGTIDAFLTGRPYPLPRRGPRGDGQTGMGRSQAGQKIGHFPDQLIVVIDAFNKRIDDFSRRACNTISYSNGWDVYSHNTDYSALSINAETYCRGSNERCGERMMKKLKIKTQVSN